jgi:NADH-quinone oxidoreductase subunit C
MKLSPTNIHDKLKARFGDAILEFKPDAVVDAWIKVAPEKILDVCLFARDEESLKFDAVMCLSGVDYKNELGVVYHLHSMTHDHKIVLKVILPKEKPHVPSVQGVWKTANWHEREAYDMMGIIFDGHPDFRRILCPDDWEGYPLRKDYKVPEFYNGIKVPY